MSAAAVYADLEIDLSHTPTVERPLVASILQNAVFIDIETTTAAEVLAERCRADGVAPCDFTAWMRKHAADHATEPIRGRVVCWAMCTSAGDELVASLDEYDGDEGRLLARLAPWLEGAGRIVAHGGRDFDFPFLRARALAAGGPALRVARRLNPAVKPWEGWLLDTTDPGWAPRPPHAKRGWSYSLDALAELLGIHRAPTLPGKDIPAAWYEGRIAEVRAHCLDDVRTLAAVTHRLAQGRAE